MKFFMLLPMVVISFNTLASTLTPIYNGKSGHLCWPTQASYEGNYFFISDYKNHRILLRNHNQLNFRELKIRLNGAHSIRYVRNIGYLIDDTEAGKLIGTKSIEKPDFLTLDSISGNKLVRPHDVIDGQDGYAYIIDKNNLYRIKDLSGKGDVIRLSDIGAGYSRSLSIIDGKLSVISSDNGSVIELTDFTNKKTHTFNTSSHKIDVPAGSYRFSGPVFNSVIRLGDYYYGSNYFSKSYSHESDSNEFRLVRWKDWNDFRSGKFEDLSGILPKGQVPYFLSKKGNDIFLTTFNHENPCDGDGVFRLSF